METNRGDRGSQPSSSPSTSASKRVALEMDGRNGPRSKRSRYTAVACNECKRRKMRCVRGDPQTPCQRCAAASMDCVFSKNPTRGSGDGENRFRAIDEKVAMLQRQVKSLRAELRTNQGRSTSHLESAVSEQLGSPRATEDRFRCIEPQQPQFVGPTRSAFGINVARSSLKSMGIATELPSGSATQTPVVRTREVTPEIVGPEDPLWSLDKEDMLKYIDIYEEEIQPVYPFVNIPEVTGQVHQLCDRFRNGPQNSRFAVEDRRQREITKFDVFILKTIIATGMVIESLGKNSLSQQLVDFVAHDILGASVRLGLHFKELVVMTIMSIYYLHTDEELLAWRMIGFAARMMFELGLHRKEVLEASFANTEKHSWAVRLVWCVYVLDRRWSFGTSLPFAIQDADIDPELPEPDSAVPYLRCLVAYGRLCSQVWRNFPSVGPPDRSIPKDTVGYLDFQIQNWLNSIPTHLRVLHPRLGAAAQNQEPGLQRLRVLLYLRANHLRTLIHRHHVLNAANIRADIQSAQLVVDIAKDTITVLVHLNESSEIYMRQQAAFNFFLLSALAAIFLAVCHAPPMFNAQCRDSFYNAVELVRSFSKKSLVSRRLWKSVKGLSHWAKSLGLEAGGRRRNGTASLATLEDSQPITSSMSTQIASRNESAPANPAIDSMIQPQLSWGQAWLSDYVSIEQTPAATESLPDVNEMSNDLANFFEAFGQSSHLGGFGTGFGNNVGSDLQSFAVENQDEVSRLFQGLF